MNPLPLYLETQNITISLFGQWGHLIHPQFIGDPIHVYFHLLSRAKRYSTGFYKLIVFIKASTRFRDTLAGRKVEVEFMSLFPLSPVPGGERFDVSSAASNLLLTIHSHKSIFQLLFLSLSR